MPEAPEVEAVVRALRPFVVGRTIRDCSVVHAIAIKPHPPAELAKALRGNRIVGVARRGKYLLLNLSRGSLIFHFKFDGQLLRFDRMSASGIHVDVFFKLDRGILGYVDPRHLGRANWHAEPETVPALRLLGVDVFSREFTVARLTAILGASRLPLKLLLMDQKRIAGLGNIYSSEALWHAQLSPRRVASRVTPAESRRVHKAIVSTVRRALECCSHPAPDFRNPEWWFADLSRILRAYGREGRPCRRCGGQIKRIQQSGRSSYFCPRCQR